MREREPSEVGRHEGSVRSHSDTNSHHRRTQVGKKVEAASGAAHPSSRVQNTWGEQLGRGQDARPPRPRNILTTELFCRVSCARERCSHPKDDYTDATNAQALLGAQLTPRGFGKTTSTFLIQTTPIAPQSNCAVWPRAVHGKKSTPLFNRRTNAGFACGGGVNGSHRFVLPQPRVHDLFIIKSPLFQRHGFY